MSPGIDGAANKAGNAPSTSGTDNPIVWFRHSSNFRSIFDGSGVSGILSLLLNVAELLYPSSVSTVLLAR